jgi:anti-sigma B factor antagonist
MIAPFEVASETVEDLHVFTVKGELDLETSPQLEQALNAAIDSGAPGVLIDLSDCGFIDSTGLAVLVAAWKAIGERNGTAGTLVLCCPDDQVDRLFKLTGLGEAIPILPGRDEAIETLSAA